MRLVLKGIKAANAQHTLTFEIRIESGIHGDRSAGGNEGHGRGVSPYERQQNVTVATVPLWPAFFCPAPIVAQFDTAFSGSVAVAVAVAVAVDVRSKFVVI